MAGGRLASHPVEEDQGWVVQKPVNVNMGVNVITA